MRTTPHSASTIRLQRHFEKWELKHLRTLAAEQAERIEQLEQQVVYLEGVADSWREDHHRLQKHLDENTEDARCIGLTMQGELLVVRTGAVQ